MVHPFFPWNVQEARLLGLEWKIICVPGGVMGHLLKSKLPKRNAWEDNIGLIWELWRRLRMMNACGISLFHLLSGIFILQDDNPARKWFLKVWIARSAAFWRWMWGGTSWRNIFFLWSAFLNSLEHSLSTIYKSGFHTWFFEFIVNFCSHFYNLRRCSISPGFC